MQRMAQIIKVKPEVIPEYKSIHAAVWPEILKAISNSNIRNYTIFLKEPENILFAYWEYHGTDFKADMEKIKKAPRMQEWYGGHHRPHAGALRHPQTRRLVGGDGKCFSHRLTKQHPSFRRNAGIVLGIIHN